MSTFSPRPATLSDLDPIEAMERASYPLQPWTRDQLRAELDQPLGRFWVFSDDETDEQIAGYVIVRLLGTSVHLINLVVAPTYRGLGFAKRLLGLVVQEGLRQKCQRVVLEVRKSNMPAIQLYQSVQFTIRHLRRGYYSNGEDAYVMELDLIRIDP